MILERYFIFETARTMCTVVRVFQLLSFQSMMCLQVSLHLCLVSKCYMGLETFRKVAPNDSPVMRQLNVMNEFGKVSQRF